MDNYGGEGIGCVNPRSVTARKRAEDRDMGIIRRDGREFRRGERGGFIPAEAAVEYPLIWSGDPKQGLGEKDPKHHTPPPLGGYP